MSNGVEPRTNPSSRYLRWRVFYDLTQFKELFYKLVVGQKQGRPNLCDLRE